MNETHQKPIEELIAAMTTLTVRGNASKAAVTGVCYDSRDVRPGMAFVAVRGAAVDGHDFIASAITRGAVAIVAERDPAEFGVALPPHVTLALVPDSRKALARVADYFYDSPSRRLKVTGVTGTNGKTTTAYLIQAIMNAAGFPCGRLGTTGYDLIGETVDAPNTTPESADVHRMMSQIVGHGGQAVAMEVSSHALTQNRVGEVAFGAAVYTNLTQDHLDYHGDMHRYFAAKATLFTDCAPNVSVINIDDPYASRLTPLITGDLFTYGLGGFADVTPEGVTLSADGTAFHLKTPLGSAPIRSRMAGRYNVYNMLGAVAAAIVHGASLSAIIKGLEGLAAAPGRFERIDEGQPFGVVVDYAHTDDALSNVLTAARAITKGKLITLFGCGGDRDSAKRPKMGRAAWRHSDAVVVTSDNPRTEEPNGIIEMIVAGIEKDENPHGSLTIIPDRREAIMAAIGMAAPGDMVVIAGKGHEDYQIVGKTKRHFDDREEARKAIKARG